MSYVTVPAFTECVTQYHYGTPPESILRVVSSPDIHKTKIYLTHVSDFVYNSIGRSSNGFRTNISNVVHPDMTKSLVNDIQDTNNFPVLSVQCTTPHAVLLAIQMLYLSALLIVSNGLAILTIRFPENFNESRYVAFSTFALGLTWIAFILTYVARS